jgi:PAS domain S-box-containing protein
MPDQFHTPPEADLLGSAPIPEPPSSKRVAVLALCVLVAIVLLIGAVAWVLVSEKRAELIAATRERLTLTAEGRAEVLATWLAGRVVHSDRVSKSELFRLFATEIDSAGGDISGATTQSDSTLEEDGDSEAWPLVEQIPLIERVLTDFTIDAGFEAGYVVGRDGVPFAATAASPQLSEAARALAEQAVQSRRIAYGRLRATGIGLVMDMAVPIISAQADPEHGPPVGALVLNVPLASGLAQALEPPPLSASGEVQGLIEMRDDGPYLLAGTGVDLEGPIAIDEPGPAAGGLDFAERQSLLSEGRAYLLAVPVSGPPWLFLRERSTADTLAPLGGHVTVIASFTTLVIALLVGLFTAFWWRLANHHNKARADQYIDLAGRIDAQKRFLDSIAGSVEELIGLKDRDGVYRYVNRAFAKSVGRSPQETVGLDDFSCFGAGAAERLKVSDERALRTGRAITVTEEVALGGAKRTLQVSKVPYTSTGEEPGLVTVARDVTDILDAQRRYRQQTQQMVSALVRAVELRDPYLAGHSRRVAGLTVAIGERMDLSADDIAALEAAANLSQIGKLKVPREILTKPARLAGAERAEVERHIEYALDILKDIDFDLPVLESLAQMHERLDGTGYPKGLAGDAISLRARILAVADVFTARIEPRGYRPVISVEAALQILASHPGRYDQRVVEVLRSVMSSIEGERLVAGLMAS